MFGLDLRPELRELQTSLNRDGGRGQIPANGNLEQFSEVSALGQRNHAKKEFAWYLTEAWTMNQTKSYIFNKVPLPFYES